MWCLWRCSTPSVWGYLCAAANAAMDARPFLSPAYEPPAAGCGDLLAVRTSLKYLHFWTELYCRQPDDDAFCSAEIAAGHVAHAELIQPLGGGRTMVRRESAYLAGLFLPPSLPPSLPPPPLSLFTPWQRQRLRRRLLLRRRWSCAHRAERPRGPTDTSRAPPPPPPPPELAAEFTLLLGLSALRH
jgi:hypothetical protein